MTKVVKTEAEWRALLDPEQYRVLREKGTEAPFSGEYDHVFEPGSYHCAGCGAELFSVRGEVRLRLRLAGVHARRRARQAVDEETDTSYGMARTEVLCADCGGHLGHVFEDGPGPSGAALLHQLGVAEARGVLAARARRSLSPSSRARPRPRRPPRRASPPGC